MSNQNNQPNDYRNEAVNKAYSDTAYNPNMKGRLGSRHHKIQEQGANFFDAPPAQDDTWGNPRETIEPNDNAQRSKVSLDNDSGETFADDENDAAANQEYRE